MPTATPSDVRDEIRIERLDDTEDIQPYLEDAQFLNERYNDPAQMDTEVVMRIERKLAAIKILTRKERSTSEQQEGDVRGTYEVGQIEELRRELDELDPSGELASLGKHSDAFVVSGDGSHS